MSKLDNYDIIAATASEKAEAKLRGHIKQIKHSQQAAANLATAFVGQVEFDGLVADAYLLVQNTPGVGETMTVDVLRNGSSVMLSGTPYTISVTATDTTMQVPLLGLLDPALLGDATGDVYTVTRAYTAGGAAAPIGATTLVIERSTRHYVKQ